MGWAWERLRRVNLHPWLTKKSRRLVARQQAMERWCSSQGLYCRAYILVWKVRNRSVTHGRNYCSAWFSKTNRKQIKTKRRYLIKKLKNFGFFFFFELMAQITLSTFLFSSSICLLFCCSCSWFLCCWCFCGLRVEIEPCPCSALYP